MDEATTKVWEALDEEVVQLCGKWKLYNQLFASGKENIDLLNKSGPYVFFQLQRSIPDSIFLALFRLTDLASKGKGDKKKENVSLANLLESIKYDIAIEHLERFQIHLEELKRASENMITHRHKRLGHRDKKYTLDDTSLLPKVTHAEIDNALEILCGMMKDIMLVLFDLGREDEPDFEYGSDGKHLLYILRKAHKLQSSK
jgi:hypothetical protein